MIRKCTLFILLSAICLLGICQSLQEEHRKSAADGRIADKYGSPADDSIFLASILNEEYGFILYENLNYRLGGDSTRHDKKGYAARGWVEDYFPSGKLLHRGYYSDGCLKIYKNYFPDGITERSYKTIDHLRSTMERYYQNGTLKSNVLYKGGVPTKWEDYYPNGKLEYMEEFNKTLDYYIVRKSFYPNGKLHETLQLVKETKRLYEHKKFNDVGVLVEKGKMIYSEIVYDYQKIGKWIIYNDTGKPIKEETYDNGRLNKEKSF